MGFEERETGEPGKLTPQKVQQILKKHGTTVSLKEAEFILEFARRFANVAVAQRLRNEAGSGFQGN